MCGVKGRKGFPQANEQTKERNKAMDINKFKELCKSVEGYVGIVERGNEIAIATTQRDCGEDGVAVSIEPIQRFLRECGIRGAVMPFPAPQNGNLIYVVRIRGAAA